MQPVQLRILSGRHFEETFQNTQGEKSNKCKQCGFASYLPDNMRRHVLTHSGKKSNKCNQCNYASSQAGNLRTHLKTHSGEKTNKCNQCDYASSQARNLRKHMKTSAGTLQLNNRRLIGCLRDALRYQNRSFFEHRSKGGGVISMFKNFGANFV